MPDLCVNIDHVATVRNARNGFDPPPEVAAQLVEASGAAGVTVHLREDRRHIRDNDLLNVKNSTSLRFNLEMAPTDEMCQIALRIRPDLCMLVPEKRKEITTESGLDIYKNKSLIRKKLRILQDEGLKVSAFVDPDPEQIKSALDLGFDACEIHTGKWAEDFEKSDITDANQFKSVSLEQIFYAAEIINKSNTQLNAGHGLNKNNVSPIAKIEGMSELHIGHSIISESIFIGLNQAIHNILNAIE